MKKVMAFGTFDIFHPGHRSFLKQAKKKGNYLMAVIARDKTVARCKKQDARNKEQQRLKKIKESKLANKTILGNLGDKYQAIKRYKPDIICLGYDQKFFVRGLKKKLGEFNLKAKVIRLKSYKPEIYKSSKLKISDIDNRQEVCEDF